MTTLFEIPKPVLQPSTTPNCALVSVDRDTAADGELSRSAAEPQTDPTAPRQNPLLHEAAACLQGYFDMRELARTKAHLMPRELYERVCRVRDYLGWRYNTLTLGGSAFEPGDWRSR